MVLVAVKQPAQPQACSFSASDMRRGIGAQEEPGLAPRRGTAQRKPVLFALGDGQAVVMRLDAADEDVVAVDDQVMRGDRRTKVRPRLGAGIGGALGGGDMLHHHAQFRQGRRRSGSSTVSMNTASRSKMSTSGS